MLDAFDFSKKKKKKIISFLQPVAQPLLWHD